MRARTLIRRGRCAIGNRFARLGNFQPLRERPDVLRQGDANRFANVRGWWLVVGGWWLVPRQHSSGGKSTLLGISKRSDRYLRTLRAHGARAAVSYAEGKTDSSANWVKELLARRNTNVTVTDPQKCPDC